MKAQPGSRELILKARVLAQVHDSVTRWRVWRIAMPLIVVSALAGGGAAVAATTMLATNYPTASEAASAGRMQSVVDRITAITGDGENTLTPTIDGTPNGFASLVEDSSQGELTLYWKGTVPESIQRVIDEHPEVDVHVVSAPYTLKELFDARDAVAKHLTDKLGTRGQLVWVGPSVDGAGIDLGVQYSEPTLDKEQVRDLVAQITPMPVEQLDLSDQGYVLF